MAGERVQRRLAAILAMDMVGYSRALIYTGEPQEAISVVEIGFDLNPQSPSRFGAAYVLARACLHAGFYERSIAWARKSLSLNPTYHHTYVCLAASLGHAGSEQEARQAIARGEALQPGFIEGWLEWSHYALDGQKQLVIEGLRKAGWTGQAP